MMMIMMSECQTWYSPWSAHSVSVQARAQFLCLESPVQYSESWEEMEDSWLVAQPGPGISPAGFMTNLWWWWCFSDCPGWAGSSWCWQSSPGDQHTNIITRHRAQGTRQTTLLEIIFWVRRSQSQCSQVQPPALQSQHCYSSDFQTRYHITVIPSERDLEKLYFVIFSFYFVVITKVICDMWR